MGAPRSVLITGASSGIGRATAECFLDAGWHVGLLARNTEALDTIAADNPYAMPLPCDIRDPQALDTQFNACLARFGRLDVLFNNAGIFTPPGLPDQITLKDWNDSVAVNLTGSFLCARKAFAIMRHQTPQGGRIINNGSVSAHSPRPNSIAYTATKHAIGGLTKSLSLDGRAFNISCGQIDIGNAATDMVAALSEKAKGKGKAEPTMDVANVARAVLSMADLPQDANILAMTIMASHMEFVGRG